MIKGILNITIGLIFMCIMAKEIKVSSLCIVFIIVVSLGSCKELGLLF